MLGYYATETSLLRPVALWGPKIRVSQEHLLIKLQKEQPAVCSWPGALGLSHYATLAAMLSANAKGEDATAIRDEAIRTSSSRHII